LCASAILGQTDRKVVLIMTADQTDWLLAAGGTVAAMVESGAEAHLVRVCNDDKDSWELSPEETAVRAANESETAAKILGVTRVHALGYRMGELAAERHTEIRDRLMTYIRRYKPDVLFLPNPYAEYVEALDRFYVGKAAEDAWRAAGLENYQPAHAAVGLDPHITPEVYYYAQPVDPRRREAESGATFVPQPVQRDIAATFAKKLRAAQALETANESMARRIRRRLDESNRRLPLLATIDESAIAKLVEINVTKLAEICARDTPYTKAEEFHYAGPEYQIPAQFRK
jgi:LmbE family N-acetylglucosaminyl deacetylase